MSKPLTFKQFLKLYPNDDVCLDHLFKARFGNDPVCPKCGQIGTFHRLKKLPAYTCNCGHHLHPMVGTPFGRTRTSLTTWFFVMFLFCASRNGVAAKEVQRQTGVTYKTAWRMCNEIRKHMGVVDGDRPLGGSDDGSPTVEVDKMFFGGYDKMGESDKAIVLGMIERDGEVVTRILKNRTGPELTPHVAEWVKPGSRMVTDDAPAFKHFGPVFGYRHETVNHLRKEYVRGDVHTNTVEGFWSHVKRSIKGTHVWVSKKHLQTYLREFEYRHNLRHAPSEMISRLLERFPLAKASR
jgi:transposase